MQGATGKSTAPPVDWSRLREQLAGWMAEDSLDEIRQAEAFNTRAQALARPVAALESFKGAPWLYFQLGRERYAIDIKWVVSIGRLVDLAPLPGAPAHLLGVANVRGQLLPVFDMRLLFGVQASGIADMGRMLLIGQEGRAEFGVLADAIDGQGMPLDIDADSPSAPADACLSGIAADGTLLINGQALLADSRLVMEDPA